MSYRLAPDDQADLKWLFNAAEAECGVRSNLGAVIDRLQASAPTDNTREEWRDWERSTTDVRQRPSSLMHVRSAGTPGKLVDPMPDRSEANRRKAMRIRDALVVLVGDGSGSRHATVLHYVYGPTHVRFEYAAFGNRWGKDVAMDLAPIAEMTGIVHRNTKPGESPGAAIRRLMKVAAQRDALREQADGLLTAASKAFDAARAKAERESGRCRAARVA